MIIVQPETTKDPISLIGREAGICWGSDINDTEKNYKRGIDCIEANHGRTLEFPQVYLTIYDYSARCMRELYTHIGGAPTRLQASTRYINYKDLQMFVPESFHKTDEAWNAYVNVINMIKKSYETMLNEGVPREDAANILPLGMMSTMVLRTNLRHLIDMMKMRQCSRAYHEIRDLMRKIKENLSEYSPEWAELCEKYMPIKCEATGFCTETYGCGLYPKREGV